MVTHAYRPSIYRYRQEDQEVKVIFDYMVAQRQLRKHELLSQKPNKATALRHIECGLGRSISW